MWFDIVCIVLALTGVVNGYRRGVLAQLGSVIGVIGGIICCHLFAGQLARYFAGDEASATTLMLDNAMAYVLVFTVCYIIGRFLGKTISRSLRILKLGFIDKLGGSLFCACEYFLVFSLLLNVWIAIFPKTKLRTDHTEVKEKVVNFAPAVLGSETAAEIYASVNSIMHSNDAEDSEVSAEDFTTADSIPGDTVSVQKNSLFELFDR